MAKAITLSNGRSWKTQTAALAHFKEMLRRHTDNQVVEGRDDHDELLALLERYDAVITHGPAKMGSGVEYCRDYFSHLTPVQFARKATEGEIDLPVIRIETSQKAAKGVHLLDPAKWTDDRRTAAKKE